MKSVLALLVFVGVAWCNSTNYYGWAPNKEFTYRYESQVLTGIPEIRDNQYAGLRLTSEVRVQTFSDYSLRVKFEKTRFLTVNGEVELSESDRLQKGSETEQGVQEAEIPSELKNQLEKPFLVHMKRGVVESFFVESSEPQSITNIKRSFLAQIQLDITGSRMSEIDSNDVEDEETPLESNEDVTYFTTREESLHGDCQTSYTIHELPKYRSLELEQQWQKEEEMLYQQVELRSKGEEVCNGKKYFRITKNKNLDNCEKRPFFQNVVGFESRCDASKSSCTDNFNHLVSTTCVVCGEPNEFTIRKCLKKDIVSQNPMGWNTEENLESTAVVSIELLREESSFSPINTPSDLKEKKSLIFEYPESNRPESQGRLNKQMDEFGIQAVLAQPDLHSAPKMLFKTETSQNVISRQIVDELKRIATDVFESPESCSSVGDVAGHLTAITKNLLPLSLEELKAIKEEVLQASHNSEASRKVLISLFYDVLSSVGTNPSIMLIKKDIESGDLTGRNAINALEGAFRAIKTPTKELLKELVKLVKNLKNLEWNENKSMGSSIKDLYSMSMVQMSKLLYRACIHPVRKMTEFPIRVYGQFCSNESAIITEEWIPYLESELESTSRRNQEDEHYRLVAISSIGKLGHIKGLHPLVKAIEGSISKRPLVRAVAVYSLKRIAKQNPVLVKPILLAIIDNPAETTQVRIAAVSVLPWAQPSMAQLQKIAVRTWFEPSKQVASFIHSTLKNMIETEVPELKAVALKASSIIHMVKPFQFGAQFSHNLNFADFVNYLKTSVSKKVAWVFNDQSVVPTKVSVSNMVYNPSFVLRGLSYSIYIQGMDQLLEKILYNTDKKSQVNDSVREQLEKISQELKIEKREDQSAEIFIQSRMAGYENLYTINKDYVMEVLERATESFRRNPQIFSEGYHFEYTRAFQVYQVQHISPTSAGLLRFREKVMPIVYSIKGSVQAENPIDSSLPIPTKVTVKLMPVVNAKVHSHSGVVCPFTQQFIGAGVDAAVHLSTPLEAKIELDHMDQVSVSLKTPESVKKSVELLHAYITPYTVRKSLKTVQPMSKAADLKQIVSRNQIKKVELNLGKKLGLSSKLIAETDAEYVDLYSYWEKIQEHSPLSMVSLGFLPSSIKKTSTKIVYNPTESESKEFAVRFSLAQGERNEEDEVEISHSDEKLIKKVCRDNYQPSSYEYERCQENLENLEIVSRAAKEVCERHSFSHEFERKKCEKTAEICEKAVKICESRNRRQAHHCQEEKKECESHIQNKQILKKMLHKMGRNSQIQRINVDASIKSRNNKQSIKTALSFGSSVEEEGKIIKYFAGAEIELPEKSAEYEVSIDGKVNYPKINNRWNTKQLLEEELKMEVDGKIKYGQKDNLKEVSFKSVMEKSEEQKQSVKTSDEYSECSQHEQNNNILSATCMKVRHQAASIDKIELNIELPEEIRQEPALMKAEEYIKAYFVSQLTIQRAISSRSPRQIKLVLDLSRAGDEAQLEVENSGLKWTVENIRMPSYLQGVLPLSLRNPVGYRLIQKITHNQSPASCTVEPTEINTFDNKTFEYEMNDCKHLLFKERSSRVPIAVLARVKPDLSLPSKSKSCLDPSGLS
jgi:hypothetical protein